jgi:hypothetical protein
MHERAAFRTDRANVSCRVGHRQVVHQATIGRPWRSTLEAKQMTGRARPLPPQPALPQKLRKLSSVKKGGPTGIDRLEPLLEPSANRVLVLAEQQRDFLNGVIEVDFD